MRVTFATCPEPRPYSLCREYKASHESQIRVVKCNNREDRESQTRKDAGATRQASGRILYRCREILGPYSAHDRRDVGRLRIHFAD